MQLSCLIIFQVLEMIGGRAGELQPGNPGGGPSQPPQMISMLLKSCDFQLTESCQQELSSKFGHEVKARGPSEYTSSLHINATCLLLMH